MKPVVLCILDGFGLNPNPDANAVALAHTPVFDSLWQKVPSTTLITFGERVGLPEGQMGTSEVGHLNIGAGRVVDQWLLKIGKAIEKGEVSQNPEFQHFLNTTAGAVHLVGLYSHGGVHSHRKHLHALLPYFAGRTVKLHLITDGRDTSPTTAINEVAELVELLAEYPHITIASVSGRFFAMDRDTRWERVQKAYDAIALGETPSKFTDPVAFIQSEYDAGRTDEFIEPQAVEGYAGFAEGDGVLFYNFREDRMREIVAALAEPDFSHFDRPKVATVALGFTKYKAEFQTPAVFEEDKVADHLAETVSKAGGKQLHIAETEKYPHVTFFLNGGVESAYSGEERIMVPSPRDVKTYDEKPEMSAEGVCVHVVEGVQSRKYDLIVVNFANCDMVGHTGVLEAAIKAVETVDSCLGRILEACQANETSLMVIADHGNCEQMRDYETGKPHTAHTTYPVPCMVVSPSLGGGLRDGGALCDVAPTVLELMGVPQPEAMTGKSLLGQ
jgi:2,3-bisphosphoglycerate-independent phosphoglycerate mutase